MKVLLTGGTGLVGKNILRKYKSGNYEFEILAPKSSELNLLDPNNVSRFIKAEVPDFVIHAAGKVGGIKANIKDPVGFLVENLDMGKNLVLACKDSRVPNFLNLGSSCMFPRNAENPLKEEMVLAGELEPTNEGYALAKVMVARLCQYISDQDSKLKYKTLIPCNLYGYYDNFNPETSHLVPSVIAKIHNAKVNGDNQVEIWGSGNVRREFMWAGDLADCILMAVENFETLPNMVNVGLGKDYSINDYYEVAAKAIGYKGEFVHNLDMPEGMKQKLVSAEKINSWGWKYKTEIEDGIRETYKYFLEEVEQ